MKTATDSTMESIVASSSDRLVLVTCSADWCGPCKRLKPILEKLDSEYGSMMDCYVLDIEENPITAKQHGILGIPSILWFLKGNLVHTSVGLMSEKALVTRIESELAKS